MNLNGQQLLTNLQSQFLKPNLPTIKIGDNIKIGVKIIEGNNSCKFSNNEEMEKDTEKKANNYKNNKTHNRKDEVNKSESILSRVEGVNVDIPER